MSRRFLFVGSLNREAPYFQGAHGDGITVWSFDAEAGRATKVSEVTGIDNPTYLTVHPTNGCIYATSEVFGWNEGVVTAYRFDPDSGRLIYLNKQPTLGAIAAYCSFDRSGRFLLVANYGMGPVEDLPGRSIAVFPVRADGGIDPAVASVAHQGSGPDAARQERAHAHCVLASPDNRFLVVADLGIDQLVAHRFDDTTGAIAPATVSALASGSGPRHFAFHPGGRFAFVINELASTICSLAYGPAAGAFTVVDTQPALPADCAVESHCAGLQISPDGRFLYAANRGHDSIAIHAVDAGSGALSLVGFAPAGGATPRDHTVDPDGRFVLVCNQNSDRVAVFRRDAATGRLTDTGNPIAVGTPMCAKFGTY